MADTYTVNSADYTRQAINDMVSNANNMDYPGIHQNNPMNVPSQNINVGTGSPMSSAIQARADQKFYNPEEQDKANKLSALQRQGNQLQTAEGYAASQYRLDSAEQNAMMQRQAQENGQRAQLIGSLFGITGGLLGMAAGGPAGAVVGSQAGNTVAQAGGGRGGGGQRAMP